MQSINKSWRTNSLQSWESRYTNIPEFKTEDGSKTIMIKASDTYVLVIAVSVLPILQDLGVEKQGRIWLRI